MNSEEWERRFKARIMECLKPFRDEGTTGEGWTQAEAERAAEGEWAGMDAEEHMRGFEEDPEGAANESLSYWGDGI